MRNETRILATLASLLTVAAVAPATAQPIDMIARVPFEFQVAGQTLPRDVYQISRASGGSSGLMLRSETRGVVVLVHPGKGYERGQPPQLVFHRIGDDYFLREVKLSGTTALDVPQSKAEREAMGRIASSAPGGVKRVVVLPER
jgi:hypothetical protein